MVLGNMPDPDCPTSSIGQIDFTIHPQLIDLSNTVSIHDMFGIHPNRSTVHNWVHKSELQPKSEDNPDHVAVDETLVQLAGEHYWLYTVVDTDTN